MLFIMLVIIITPMMLIRCVPNVSNEKGLMPIDIATNLEIKALLENK